MKAPPMRAPAASQSRGTLSQALAKNRSIWISAIVHVGGLAVAMVLPAPPAAAAALPVVIELAAVPPPAAPVTAPTPAPEPEPAPQPEPEPTPVPQPAKTPRPAKSPAAKAPRAAKPGPAAPAAGPPTAGTAAPGEAGIRSLGGEFGGGADSSEGSAPADPKPAGPAPKTAAEPEEPKCTEVLVKAKPLQVPTPAYPETQRDNGIAGKVRIQLKIGEDGQVLSAKVLEGLGEPFDSAALEAAKAATFEPASRCGQPVASIFTLGIRFTP